MSASRAPDEGHDPYAGSVAARRLRAALDAGRPLRIACLDIDSTLTGDPDVANEARAGLEDAGFVVGFDTSRTEEMVLSQAAYRESVWTGALSRPEPRLGREGDRRVYVPPERREPAALIDPEFVAGSSGTRILLRQPGATYLPDRGYEARFGFVRQDHLLCSDPLDHTEWRRQTLGLLESLWGAGIPGKPASIEYRENYRTGRSDVYPPDYRIQVDFDSLDEKLTFVAALRDAKLRGDHAHVARAIHTIDDSHPKKSHFKVFVVPLRASKARAIERLVEKLCAELQVARSALTLLFTGDSFPDLAMGLFGGLGTQATLLLVGESRLLPGLVTEGLDFAGEPLGAIRRRLSPAGCPGWYHFRLPARGTRTLISGGEAFPGTRAVETVRDYVQTI